MSKRKMAVLLVGLILGATFANAASKNTPMRIKVLDSETRSVVLDDSGVPKNCDGLNYDAYCNSSRTALVTNTSLVQQENGISFRIACTIDTKWSKCIPLPKGETFDARKEKHGITVYYQDDDGKARKQLYALLGPVANANSVATTAVPAPSAPAPTQNAAQSATTAAPPVGLQETVRCSFSSAPSGAEVTLDGRYVGSTPSILGLAAGDHVVVMSMPGFLQWKRELTVAPGSDLSVNAVFEKQ